MERRDIDCVDLGGKHEFSQSCWRWVVLNQSSLAAEFHYVHNQEAYRLFLIKQSLSF